MPTIIKKQKQIQILRFLLKSIILHVVANQTVVWYVLFLNLEVCKKYHYSRHNCCMFERDLKNVIFKKKKKST